MENALFGLHGKVAIVTGGAKGIGAAISTLFAKQGAQVYILDMDEEAGEKWANGLTAMGKNAFFKFCDVSHQEEVVQVVSEIYQASGRLDILVNNAGVAHIGRADNTSEKEFDQVFEVNVKGVYNCLFASIPKMKLSGGGAILNLASVVSEVGIPERFAYSASKGAVLAMTYSVAKDYIHDNIRCNSIAPGRVYTPFVEGYLKKTYPGKEQEMFEALSKTQPIGRMGKPEEIAYLALYLCADESSFITGTNYPIDGGFIRLNS